MSDRYEKLPEGEKGLDALTACERAVRGSMMEIQALPIKKCFDGPACMELPQAISNAVKELYEVMPLNELRILLKKHSRDEADQAIENALLTDALSEWADVLRSRLEKTSPERANTQGSIVAEHLNVQKNYSPAAERSQA